MIEYLGLCLAAFIAATPIPMNSEIVFLAMQAADYNLIWLIILASVSNSLGSCVTYACGKSAQKLKGTRWFPFPDHSLEKTQRLFNRWGYWSLIFAWLPGGDLLVAFAGFMKMNFTTFFILILLGKTLRYAALGLTASGILAVF